MDWTLRSWSYTSNPRSLLLELPPELRALIFDFAVTSHEPLVTFPLDDYQRETYREAVQPNLTRVSRLVRKESLPIFYSNNTFTLHSEVPKCEGSQQWVDCVHPRLDDIARLELWVRYVTLPNAPSEGRGAFALLLSRGTGELDWVVDEGWTWVTVTRQPADAERDAELLIAQLTALLRDFDDWLEDGEQVLGVVRSLRRWYVEKKTI